MPFVFYRAEVVKIPSGNQFVIFLSTAIQSLLWTQAITPKQNQLLIGTSMQPTRLGYTTPPKKTDSLSTELQRLQMAEEGAERQFVLGVLTTVE